VARLRAIEGGFSVSRSVRGASSAAFDAFGRIRGWLPYYEDNDRILVVALPARPVPTMYSRLGDVLVYLSIAFLCVIAWLTSKSQREIDGKHTAT
jgi:apolipoprotein N-acyltransferase